MGKNIGAKYKKKKAFFFSLKHGFDTVKINFSLEDENVIFLNSCVWIQV